MRLLFQSKENRDMAFKELKAQGKAVKKSSISGQQLHPQYVEDFPDKSIKADNGFGNVHYKTFFPKLYRVESEE